MLIRVLYSLLLLPIFFKGFGSIIWMEIFSIIFLSCIYVITKRKSVALFSLIIYLIAPSIIHIWSVLAFILLQNKLYGFSIVALFLTIIESIYIPTTMMSLFIIYMIGLLLSLVPHKFAYKLNLVLALIAISFSIPDIIKRTTKEPISIEKYDIESVYSPSDVFCKTTNSKYFNETNSPQRILRSIMFNTSIKNENEGIVIHEIDTDDSFKIRHCQEWQQPTSWHHNQLLGSQYILEAIRNDGGLYSNKGVCFSDTGFVRLAYPYSTYKSQPLILDLNEVTHLHDSDYTSSYLANYQSSLNNEIVQNGYRHILLRVLSILFLLAIVLQLIHFPYFENQIQNTVYFLILSVFLIIYIYSRAKEI